MKKVLFLLLITSISYGQALFDKGIKVSGGITTDNTATKVVIQSSNNILNTIAKSDLIEVLEYASAINLPVTGVSGKIYVTIDNRKLYRWNGTIYQELAVTDISSKENISNKQNSLAVDGTGVKYPTVDAVRTHTNDVANPHAVTKTQVGLSNVDNTTDLLKPISTATQTALNGKIGGSGTINSIPKFTETGAVGNSQIVDDGTDVIVGGGVTGGKLTVLGGAGANSAVYIRKTDQQNGRYGLTIEGGSFNEAWINFKAALTIFRADGGIIYDAGVGNSFSFRKVGSGGSTPMTISTANNLLIKTISDNGIDAIQTPGTVSFAAGTLANQGVIKSQLDLKANIASPTFTGVPTVPTAAAGTNTTQIASTAFVSISFLPKASPIFTGEIFGSGNYVTESNFKLGATNTGLERYGSSGASFKEISNVWTSNVNLTAPSFIKTGGTSFQFLMADGSVSTATPPIQLKDFYADVNNVGLTETDLFTYTTPASRLNASGEKIIAVYAGTMNDVTASSQLKAYFAGTLIADTGALTMSVTGAWVINASIIRTGATTAKSIVNISTPGASTASYTKYTSLTGLTFTNTNIIKVTGTAAGATGGDNDITATYGNILWQPAAL